MAWEREGHYAWVGEYTDYPVIEVATGKIMIYPPDLDNYHLRPQLSPVILEGMPLPGVHTDAGYEMDMGFWNYHNAFGLTRDLHWRWLSWNGQVGQNEEIWYFFDFAWEASAFGPRAERLALLAGDQLAVWNLETRTAEGHWVLPAHDRS